MEELPKKGCTTTVSRMGTDKELYSFACDNPKKNNILDVQHLINYLQKGNSQLKEVLFNECELIYLCKICREVYCCVEHLVEHFYDCCHKHFGENCTIFNENNSTSKDDNGCNKNSGQLCEFNSQNPEAEKPKKKKKKPLYSPREDGSSPEIPPNATSVLSKYHIKLNEEELKHVDAKNLICETCKVIFRNKAGLSKHVAVVHLGYKRLRCKFCDFKTNNFTECKKHMIKIHKQDNSFKKNILHLHCTF